jgi:hypothetical protein
MMDDNNRMDMVDNIDNNMADTLGETRTLVDNYQRALHNFVELSLDNNHKASWAFSQPYFFPYLHILDRSSSVELV